MKIPLLNEKTALLKQFVCKDTPQNSVITLGGTGPNGSSQVAHLHSLGLEYIHVASTVNILSASCFAYFIYLSLCAKEGLRTENYLNYDKGMRKLHKASFFKALLHYSKSGIRNKPLYANHLLQQTINYLFETHLTERTLSELNPNLVFWAYCANEKRNIRITAREFPCMKVWQVICACVSIPFMHGEFSYKSHRFIDGIFSPNFSGLKREILKSPDNHLYLNYKKQARSGNVFFLRNSDSKFPQLELLADFLMLAFGIPNYRVNRTHRRVIKQVETNPQQLLGRA
jgi:hypothetical protein